MDEERNNQFQKGKLIKALCPWKRSACHTWCLAFEKNDCIIIKFMKSFLDEDNEIEQYL